MSVVVSEPNTRKISCEFGVKIYTHLCQCQVYKGKFFGRKNRENFLEKDSLFFCFFYFYFTGEFSLISGRILPFI